MSRLGEHLPFFAAVRGEGGRRATNKLDAIMDRATRSAAAADKTLFPPPLTSVHTSKIYVTERKSRRSPFQEPLTPLVSNIIDLSSAEDLTFSLQNSRPELPPLSLPYSNQAR